MKFENAVEESWKISFSEWPNKSFFLPTMNQKKTGQSAMERDADLDEILEFKKEFYQRLLDIMKNLKNRNIFVIKNFKLNEKKVNFLRIASEEAINAYESICLDFVIFISNCQIIIIKFTKENFDDAIIALMNGNSFLYDVAAMSLNIQPILASLSKQDNQGKSNKVIVCNDLPNLVELVKSKIELAAVSENGCFLSAMKKLAYILKPPNSKENQ